MMPTKPSWIAPTRGERLTAEVALIASRRDPADACLTSGHLAALVDGRLDAATQAAALAHLADCERCCSVWREVAAATRAREAQGGLVVRLLRPRGLAAIGSALALAASVMVFVHLRQDGVPRPGMQAPLSAPELHLQEGPAERQQLRDGQPQRQDAAPATPPVIAPPVPTEQVSPATPAPASVPAAEDVSVERRARSSAPPPSPAPRTPSAPQPSPPAVEKSRAEPRAKSSALPAASSVDTATGTGAAQGEPAPAALPAPPAVERGNFQSLSAAPTAEAGAWQRQVLEACRQPSEEVRYWAEMQATGQALAARLPAGLVRQRQEAFVVALAGIRQPTDIVSRCDVLRRLASAGEPLP